MPRRALTIPLAVGATVLITLGAFAYGRASRPLVSQLADLGGEYRELRDSLGIEHTGVVHRIEAHCYSPGVGLMIDAPAGQSPDSLYALATVLRSALEREARVGEDRYLTVTLDAGSGALWTLGSRMTYTFAWTWSERQQRWIHFAFSVPPGSIPRVLQSSVARPPRPVT